MLSTLEERTKIPHSPAATLNGHDKTVNGKNGASHAGDGKSNDTVFMREPAVLGEAMLGRVRAGLQFLWNSYVYAQDLAADPWEFSVEWLELRRFGLMCSEVRWLIRQGLVQPAYEVTSAEDDRRRFVPYSNLNLSKRTCLVLTESGCKLSRQLVEAAAAGRPTVGEKPTAASFIGNRSAVENRAVQLAMPIWDRDRRQLRVDGRVVKEFKVPAPNQEIILGAFEEENWPPKIDDPLPHKLGIVPQRRLHDTINSLNRRQRHRLLHFAADGLGRGICWEFLSMRQSRG